MHSCSIHASSFLYLLVSYVYAKEGGNDSVCSNLWSAINTMQNGVDLTTFDLFGEDPGWSRLPLLQYTCNSGTTWTNSINKVAYSIPDQFAQAPISIPDDVTQYEFHQSTHTKEVKKVMAKSIHLGLLDGMFSSTTTFTDAFEVITAETRLWGAINSSISSFKVNLIPYQLAPDLIHLSDNALNYIEDTIKQRGPVFNASTAPLYEQFSRSL